MRPWPAPHIPVIPGEGPDTRVLDARTGELTVPETTDQATIYVCGITPYDATHLGHAATYVAFDLLIRAWIDSGKSVTYVQNATDIDTPLLERAAATGADWEELAHSQLNLFRNDMTALSVIPPDHFVAVTEVIPQIAASVSKMLADGTAYSVPVEDHLGLNDIYADLKSEESFDPILQASDAETLALFAERGGDPERPGKRNPMDPLLWRAARDGEPEWPHEGLPSGRPGWHIGCATIACECVDGQLSVQAGGRDLIFPHHAMSCSHIRLIAGRDAKVGAVVHAGMVGLDGDKMSKSKGNLVFVHKLLADGVSPMAIRLAILAHKYNDDWEWTDEVLATAQRRLEAWKEAFGRDGGPAADVTVACIRAALSNDLDAPGALVAVDAWVSQQLDQGNARGEAVEAAPGVVSRAVDALLGIRF